MTNQGAISDKDASLILEFTSHIDKHIFPYVQVLPIICVDGWKSPTELSISVPVSCDSNALSSSGV